MLNNSILIKNSDAKAINAKIIVANVFVPIEAIYHQKQYVCIILINFYVFILAALPQRKPAMLKRILRQGLK